MQPSVSQLLALAQDNPLLSRHIEAHPGGSVAARLETVCFGSEFSPIYDLGSYANSSTAPSGVGRFGDEIGFEAKLKLCAPDGGPTSLTAREYFSSIEEDQRLIDLDRLSRAVHAINYFSRAYQGLLFLNVHERLLKSVRYDHGRSFSQILQSCGLNPARVVIEIPEPAAAHKTLLDYLIRSYQGFGFKVAANLPNAGQILSLSDIARLDYMKIDAKTAIRDSMVKALVGFAARMNVPLIFKRITDETQFHILQQCDIRFAQGEFFSDSPEAPRIGSETRGVRA